TADAAPATTSRSQMTRVAGQRIELPPGNGSADVEQAWDAFFAAQVEKAAEDRVAPADVHETVRWLMNRKPEPRLEEAIAVIRAALRHGFPQPWMYESLGLALRARGAEDAEIERTLMSSLDFSASPDEMYYLASYMARAGYHRRALQLYRDLAEANPNRPEPFTQALTLAQHLEDEEAIRWACVGVLSQPWRDDEKAIESRAVHAATAAMKALRTAGETETADTFLRQLNEALVRDCVVNVSYSGDADLDLLVEEPSGTLCSLQAPRTTGGGVLLGDASSISEEASVQGITESYECARGFTGRYRVLVRPVWGEVTAGKVDVSITVNRGTSSERTQKQTLELGDKPIVVQFELAKGRRQEPLQEQQIASLAKREAVVGQAALAQQISNLSAEDSEAIQDLIRERLEQFPVVGFPILNGAVGYQPQITQLPEGTTMFATAVISADRRYVRVSPSPVFSGVGDVFTFNFVSGQQTQQP
ncbi:MAG: tetratricopeptide repeat protein, partial [Planctomycetales bacterium]|nr:tetratricopeptide repeat protein [Planctomycetales bacterium]